MRRSRLRTAVFALVPLAVFLLAAEGISRAVLSSASACEVLFGTSAARHPHMTSVLYDADEFLTADPYCGYRIAPPDDPRSRRPPPDAAPARTEGEVRILCLGDSVTHGMLLPVEAAWPGRLEALLNQDPGPAAGRHFVVYNGGVPGYGPVQCKRALQSRFIDLEPDVVYWLEQPGLADSLELPPVMSERMIRLTRAASRSRLVYLLLLLRPHHSPNEPLRLYDAAIRPGEGPPATLDDLAGWTKQHGAGGLVAVEYLMRTGGFGEPYGIAGNAAAWSGLDVPLVRTAAALARVGVPEALIGDRVHFTAEGADAFARIVAADYRANRAGYRWHAPASGGE